MSRSTARLRVWLAVYPVDASTPRGGWQGGVERDGYNGASGDFGAKPAVPVYQSTTERAIATNFYEFANPIIVTDLADSDAGLGPPRVSQFSRRLQICAEELPLTVAVRLRQSWPDQCL